MIKRIIIKLLAYLLVLAMFLAGLLIFSYPLLSGYMSDRNSTIYIEEFESEKKSYLNKNMDTQSSEELSELYKEMQEYNEAIFENGQDNLCDAWA
ncbi:MAG: hypothetical protein J1E41_03815, partial [Ruminococcus sp.]|nr:hypothetical protein [Ruminococcus sp.]